MRGQDHAGTADVTVKSQHRDGAEPGFHLYHDVLEEMACEADDTELPVYLCLEGVEVELQTVLQGGATVTVKIPHLTARALGLAPDPPGAPALALPCAEDSR